MIYVWAYLFVSVLFAIVCVALDMFEFQSILDEITQVVPAFITWPLFVIVIFVTCLAWPYFLPVKIKNRIQARKAKKETKHEI